MPALQKKVSETLRESESYSRLLFETSPIGLALCQMDGHLVDVNHAFAAILGRSIEETLQLSYWDITPRDYAEQETEQLKLLEQKGRYGPYEKEYIHRDGHRVPVRLQGTLLEREGQRFIWSSVEDISTVKAATTELEQHRHHLEELVQHRTEELQRSQQALVYLLEDANEANTRLRELDQLKSLFIASMNHELRTPLNAVIGFSSILHDEWVGPLNLEQKENLAIILRSGKHLLALINDIIDISKLEAGQIEPHPEEFPLKEVVDEALTLLRPQADGKRLRLRAVCPDLDLRNDRRRLLQILLNLLSNAVKFTSEGEIVLTVEVADERVLIKVSDTGHGIPEDQLPRLFKPFSRLRPAMEHQQPGTGLGLYLSRNLAEKVLKGGLDVRSRWGEGSCFTLHLPRRLTP